MEFHDTLEGSYTLIKSDLLQGYKDDLISKVNQHDTPH